MDDRDLIRRAAEGDLDAFAQIVERKRERVFRIARHVVGDPELARDVTQEVFVRLFRVVRRFRQEGIFDVWLNRIALNLAIDALRRERPHRETASLDAPVREGPAVGPAAARPGGAGRGRPGDSPAASSLRTREIRRIFDELGALLPKKQRLAFILREIEGLPTGEVAAIMKTSESTIRNHVLAARRVLRVELRRRYPEYCPGKGEEGGGEPS